MGKQYNKVHAVTALAAAAVSANRFVGYDGTHATSAGGLHDSQGISEHSAATAVALSVVTSYSYLVETGAAITKGDFLKPAADGSGKAIVGAVDDHCARALEDAGLGALVEAEILTHRHPSA